MGIFLQNSKKERKLYMSFISRNTQITDVADLLRYNKYCIELCGGPLFEIRHFFVEQSWYYIITDIYDQ